MRFEDDQMKYLSLKIVEIVNIKIDKILSEEIDARIKREVEVQIDNRLRKLLRVSGDKE